MTSHPRFAVAFAALVLAAPAIVRGHFKLVEPASVSAAIQSTPHPGGYSYHHCAALQITADASKPLDKGWPAER